MPEQEKKLNLADDKIKEITDKIEAEEKKGNPLGSAFGRITDETSDQLSIENKISNAPSDKREEGKLLIKNLRTFQGDVAEAIKKQNASIVTVALAEKERKEKREKEAPVAPETRAEKERKTNFRMAIASIALIVVGLGAITGFYIFYKETENAPVVKPNEKTLIGFTSKSDFDATLANKDDIVQFVKTARETVSLSPNSIHYIAIQKKVGESIVSFTPQELLTLLQTKAPLSLQRALGESVMLGLYRGTANETFLLFSLESFDRAYAGMLEWENTMNADIGALFSKRTLQIIERDPETLGTTTVSVQNFDDVPGLLFEDETIKNKDVRILKNTRGETIFLYTFIDEKTLLIVSSETAQSEIINKVISERLVR